MTFHNNQGSINNGYYAPNKRANQNSFISVPKVEIFKPTNYHGTPMMPFKPFNNF